MLQVFCLMIFSYKKIYGINKHNWINIIWWYVLPVINVLSYFISNREYESFAIFKTIDFLYLLRNLTCSESFIIQTDNLLTNIRNVFPMLFINLGLKSALSISDCIMDFIVPIIL